MQNAPGDEFLLTRRRVLRYLLVGSGVVLPGMAFGNAADLLIDAIVGERKAETGELKLTTPAIAENGNTVPITVEAGGPFQGDQYVKAIHIFAMDNPTPEVITFNFTPRAGLAKTSTRIRLAKTQQVVAVAELSDGRVWRTANEVKVTIGGCGG